MWARVFGLPYRVLFKELTDFFQCAVVDHESKPAIADTKLRFFECHSSEEAHFLCGLLNSSPRHYFSTLRQLGFKQLTIKPAIFPRINLPRYVKANRLHAEIARCSRDCHALVASGDHSALRKVEQELSSAAAKLWGMDDDEPEGNSKLAL